MNTNWKRCIKMLFTLCAFLLLSSHAWGQQTISGTITDAENSSSIPGASVLVKGTTNGAVSDLDGKYTLEAQEGDILVVSFVGYINEEYTVVSGQSIIDVELNPDIIGLEEVIVTGYGVQKKSDVTGAIASVSGEKLTEMPVSGIDQALQGRAAGVQVMQNSGAPGSDVTIRIRGISSINGADPLFILDGSQVGKDIVSALNPTDIESIEVLKDNSSAAIYGASGGNGVVLITTKKGKQGDATVSFNMYVGQQSVWNNIDLTNTSEFVNTYNQVFPDNTDFDDPSQLPDTDWQKELFRDAMMQNYDLTVQSGGEKSKVLFSTSYFTQEGVVPNSDYKRLTARINSESQIHDRIKIGENLSIVNTKSTGFEEWQLNNGYLSPIKQAVEMHPFVDTYNEDGTWGSSPLANKRNPFTTIDITDKERDNYRVFGNAYVEIEFIKGLTFMSRIGGDVGFYNYREFQPKFFYTGSDRSDVNQLNKSKSNSQSWNWQNYLTYQKSINNHKFSVMAGYEAGHYYSEFISGSRKEFSIEEPEQQHFSVGKDPVMIVDGSGEEASGYAFFGRINYDFKGKYLVTLNGRQDYSSKFGPENRSGFFPSYSVGWKFSEEEFIKNNLPVLSFGKLRFGQGSTGNSQIRPYAYYPTIKSTYSLNYNFGNIAGSPSIGGAPAQIPNYEIGWEEIVTTNLGLDLTFFQNRLSVTAEYFEKENIGMLISKEVPRTAGIFTRPGATSQEGGDERPIVNAGTVKNSGYELTLGYKHNHGDFSHEIDLNFTYVKNVVKDIAGDSLWRGSAKSLNNIALTREGDPMGSFVGYETDGLFQESDAEIIDGELVITNQPYTVNESSGAIVYAQPNAQPGDLKFKDINNDGILNAEDRTIIGNPHPTYHLGLSYNLGYKNFDLSLFFQGAFGHEIFNATKQDLYNPSGENNWAKDITDSYRSPTATDPGNTNTDLFRMDPRNANNNLRVSDFYIEDGAYVRLRNLQIGYTIPRTLTQQIGVDKFRVYVGMKNLLTFTKYSGFDPEVVGQSDPLQQGIDQANYPQARTFLVGLNVNF